MAYPNPFQEPQRASSFHNDFDPFTPFSSSSSSSSPSINSTVYASAASSQNYSPTPPDTTRHSMYTSSNVNNPFSDDHRLGYQQQSVAPPPSSNHNQNQNSQFYSTSQNQLEGLQYGQPTPQHSQQQQHNHQQHNHQQHNHQQHNQQHNQQIYAQPYNNHQQQQQIFAQHNNPPQSQMYAPPPQHGQPQFPLHQQNQHQTVYSSPPSPHQHPYPPQQPPQHQHPHQQHPHQQHPHQHQPQQHQPQQHQPLNQQQPRFSIPAAGISPTPVGGSNMAHQHISSSPHTSAPPSSTRPSSSPVPSGISMTPVRGSPTVAQTYVQSSPAPVTSMAPQRSGSFSGSGQVPKPVRQTRAASLYVVGAGDSSGGLFDSSYISAPVISAAAITTPRPNPEVLAIYQHDVEQISAMFPDVPRAAIEADICKTTSRDQTVNNILDGRLAIPEAQPPPAQPAAQPQARAPVVPALPSPGQRPTNPPPPPAAAALRVVPPAANSPRPPLGQQPSDDLPSYEEFESPRSGIVRLPPKPLNERSLEEFEQYEIQIVRLTAQNVEVEYQQAVRQLDAINGQLQATQTRYTLLQKQTQKEYKDTLKYKKTTRKSLMAKMKGTLEEKIAKEEAEYVQAKSKEESARLEVEELSKQQEKLTNQSVYFSTQMKSLRTSQAKQQQILDSAHDPQVHGYEEELARLEIMRNQAAQDKLCWEACKVFLERAYENLVAAHQELQAADAMASFDSLTNTSLADLAKNSPLSNVRNHIQISRIALESARKHVPNIPTIQHENIQSLNALIDFVFDGALVDIGSKQKNNETAQKLDTALQNVYNALSWTTANLNSNAIPSFQRMDAAYSEARNLLKEQRVLLIMQAIMNPSVPRS